MTGVKIGIKGHAHRWMVSHEKMAQAQAHAHTNARPAKHHRYRGLCGRQWLFSGDRNFARAFKSGVFVTPRRAWFPFHLGAAAPADHPAFVQSILTSARQRSVIEFNNRDLSTYRGVVVSIGTNDMLNMQSRSQQGAKLTRGQWDRVVKDLKSNLLQSLLGLQERGCRRIILMNPTPFGFNYSSHVHNKVRQAYSDLAAHPVFNIPVRFVDSHKVFYARVPKSKSKNLYVRRELLDADLIHWNEKGQAEVKKLIWDAMTEATRVGLVLPPEAEVIQVDDAVEVINLDVDQPEVVQLDEEEVEVIQLED